MNKKPLQIATLVLGLVPLITGLVTMFGIQDPIYRSINIPADPLLDSNLRFFGGVWLALGIAAFWMVPRIETQTTLFRLLWGAIFVGGIGRLLSMVFVGWPPLPFIGFTALEVLGAPLFIGWQHKVAMARRRGDASGRTDSR